MVCSVVTTSISNRREAGEVFVQSVYKSLEGNTTRTQCDTADHAGDCFGTKMGIVPAAADTRGIAVFPDPSSSHQGDCDGYCGGVGQCPAVSFDGDRVSARCREERCGN